MNRVEIELMLKRKICDDLMCQEIKLKLNRIISVREQ